MPKRIPRWVGRRVRKFLLTGDPILAATFFVGFMIVSVFIVIVYARFLTEEVERAYTSQDEKIIVASISSCKRTNELRMAVNGQHEAISTFLTEAVRSGNFTPTQLQNLQRIVDASEPVRVPNCERDIRAITGPLLRRADETNGR